jgi:CHAT domain-containing protein
MTATCPRAQALALPLLLMLVLACTLGTAGRARAQGDMAEPAPLIGSASERQALQARVDAPTPVSATAAQLTEHFSDRIDAARRLGDAGQLGRVLQQAMQAQPEFARWPNDAGLVARDAGRHAEALQLFDRAIALARRPVDRLFYRANRLSVPAGLAPEKKLAEAAALRSESSALLQAGDSRLGPFDRTNLLRVHASGWWREAEVHRRRYALQALLEARAKATQGMRDAVAMAQTLPPQGARTLSVTAAGLAAALREQAYSLILTGRYSDAEELVQEQQRLTQAHGLSAGFASGALHLQALLRLRRGEFEESGQLLRRSQQVLDQLRYPRGHPFQLARSRDLLLVSWALGRHDEGLADLEQIDLVAVEGGDRPRLRYPFERGLLQLGAGRPAEAVRSFTALEAHNRATLGPGHYFTLMAQALVGAAEWATADPTRRESAARRLQAAVPAMLAPRHADFLDDSGVRPQVRRMLMTRYLEAVAWRGSDRQGQAFGVADRLLADATGQAMTDAALRAATADPALAELLRQEQDARLQARALLEDLQEGADDGRADKDSDALRERLSAAEARVLALGDELRQRFPEFERLIRPPLPSPAAVGRLLRPEEALWLALPTPLGLFQWLVGADGQARFRRVDVPLEQLQKDVEALRSSLDFSRHGGRIPRFDHATAQLLHERTLAPVADALAGRRHLIVVTSGALAALPFAALQTGPGEGPGAPWLARRLALSQAPSVAAWLAMQQLPRAPAAPEPLLAWADPSYGPHAGHASGAVQTPPAAAGGHRKSLHRPASTVPGGTTLATLPPLPETRDEATAIAGALRADPARDVISGRQATRDSVLEASRSGRLARKRVVVFATHGLMAGDLPGLTQPALALAPGGGQAADGLIGLDDILGLRLNADWVVLSACNTAAGDGRSQAALSGLARGFLYAGGRSLLVTHWAVETESAKRLTTATLAHHARDGSASKAESLRQAMLSLMDEGRYAHPAYWAPFALVGDGSR